MKNTDLKLGKLHHSALDPNIQQRSLGTKNIKTGRDTNKKVPNPFKNHKDKN